MKLKLLTFFILATIASKAQTLNLYVGTYTNANSEGIYKYHFNENTGELTNKVLVAKTANPSFLTFSANKEVIYAVNEIDNFNGSNSGSVSAFKIIEGKLHRINQVSTNGAHPCHISINKEGTKAVISNYTGGTISIHSILKNGEISTASQIIDHTTNGEKSHTHSAKFYKNKLFVADLGLNKLSLYTNLKNSDVNYEFKSNFTFQKNAGPRHFELSKKGDFIYVINELNSTISILKKNNNLYNFIQNISTLDEGFLGKSYCADIHLSKNGKFLYGSNRGENSIVTFKVNKNGTLKKIQTIPTNGDWPRNFTLSPNGKFLLVANQKSNNISVYTISAKTGILTFKKSVEAPTPVCLLF